MKLLTIVELPLKKIIKSFIFNCDESGFNADPMMRVTAIGKKGACLWGSLAVPGSITELATILSDVLFGTCLLRCISADEMVLPIIIQSLYTIAYIK